jgi:anti-sigma factor RsiW
MSDLWGQTGGLVTEDELHAYVDRQIAPARRPAVKRYLSAHPEEALRVKAYGTQRGKLRTLLAAQVGRAVPPQLDPWLLMEERLGARQTPFRPTVCA